MSGVKVVLECGGCDAKSKAFYINQKFRSFSGRGHGLGVYEVESITSKAPDDWCVFDLIGCTYCPKCTAEIFGEQQQDKADER